MVISSSIMRGFRLEHLLKRLLERMNFYLIMEFVLLSKYHKENPYVFGTGHHTIQYEPRKAALCMFGGNLTGVALSGCQYYMIIQSLRKYYTFMVTLICMNFQQDQVIK
jgi:hypothetical protein